MFNRRPAAARPDNAWRPSKMFWIVAAIVLLLLISAAQSSGIGGIIVMLGLVAFITGLFALLTKRKSWVSLPHRKSAGIVTGAGFVALLIGSGVAGATAAPGTTVAKPAALVATQSQSPEAESASQTPTETNPVRTSCVTAAATASYQGNALVCTKDADGRLLWLPEAESAQIVKAAAEKEAAEKKAVADKAAADKLAADQKAAADKAAADKAAADKLAADQKAAADAAAAEAARQRALVPAAPAAPAAPAGVYFANCTEAKAAGAAPMRVGSPGYRTALDRDRDGIACDK